MSHNPRLTLSNTTTSTGSATDERMDFSYDGTLVTSISQSGVLNQSISYTYNNDFNPTSMTYANQTENYTYNADNEAVSIGNYTITRQKKNRVIKVSDGTYTYISKYNRYGELKHQRDNALRVRLFRNKVGQIVRKVEKLKGERKRVYRYSYDERGRLVKACRVGLPSHQGCERYTYDNNGNRASATVNGTSITASYTLDDNLVVYGDNSYLYDDDGYLKEKTTPQGTTTYTYGTRGELLSVTTTSTGSVTVITYKHNALNQRVAKLLDGQVVEKYLWENLTTLLAIYDANDNLIQRFEYADSRMPIAMTMNAQKYYLHYDQVGSLRAVSRVLSPDNTFEVVKEIVYDTYGNIISDTNSSFKVPFGFAGGLYDADTKLTRFGYRDYDAYTGKWTAKDPIGFSGGDSNLYGYVLGDPVGGIDPMGLSDIDLTYGESPYSTYDTLPWNNPNDKITIGGHGCATGIPEKVECDEDHIAGYDKSNIENLANQIRNLPKYQNNPNMPILLQVCYAGSTNLPQILANLLGRNVGAYSGSYYPGLGIGIGYTTFSPAKQE